MEMQATLLMLFVPILCGLVYLLVKFCDLNLTEDVIRGGLCQCRTTKSVTEAEAGLHDGDSDSDDEESNKRRCCIRYNYMERMKVRKQLVTEIEQEELTNNQLEFESGNAD